VYASDAKALESKFFAGPKALEVADYAAHAMKVAGDPVRGQRLFSDESGVACIKCHKVGDKGNSVGPELTSIGAQFSRATLIEHVLEPSKVVREGYQAYNLELKDGDSLTALIKGETADALTVVDVAGVSRTIPVSQISSRTKGTLSLMPEGLQAGLTLDEFADLIAYLESRKPEARKP
jgi:putative heme-binding domain-containing protein